jgi:hypothetical protein
LQNLDLVSNSVNLEQALIRNNELFPFLKQRIVILENSHVLALTQEDIEPFLEILCRVVPQISI